MQQVQIEQFSGPLPSPEILAKYAEIYPGLEKAIVEMAHKQTAHRIELERTVILSREKQSQRGQTYAFILGVLFIALAAFALYRNYPAIAYTILGFTITSVIAFFITAKVHQKPKQNQNQKQANCS